MDTGIPTAIAHQYANPTAALDAALTVIPTGQRIAQEGRSLDIRQQATDASIRQEDSRISLARAQEERMAQVTGAQLDQMRLGTALDAALFDTKVKTQQAQAKSTIIAANFQARTYDRQAQNEPQLVSLANDLANVDHEAMARGDLDQSFNIRIQGLVGLDAQTTARTAYNATKQRSFDLIHNANVQELDPDLRAKFTPEFQDAANGVKPYVFDKYRALQGDRTLVRAATTQNDQFRFDAPTLAVPVEKFMMPDGRVDSPGLQSAMVKAKTLYDTDKAQFDGAMAIDNGLIAEKTKTQAVRMRAIDAQMKDVRDDANKLESSRSRIPAPVPVDSITASANDRIAKANAKAGVVTPPPPPDAGEEKKKVLDAKLAEYSTQLLTLQKQRDTIEKERPLEDFHRSVLGLQAAVANSSNDIKRAGSDTTLTPEVRDQRVKEASDRAVKARADFESFLGRAGSSKFYDGSLRYNNLLPVLRGSSVFGFGN